jgi:shikimate dehydrogenase
MTDRYAVIGQPISHSKSPVIHARFARETAQDLTYEAIEIAPANLADELKRLHAEGVRGLNVTLPHKHAVAKICESVSERGQLAGAVNTLVRTATGWTGDNTDGAGLVADLARLGIGVAGRKVLILGAGGATRGIIGPLLGQNPAALMVSNRNPWKPEELAEAFKAVGRVIPRTHLALKGDRFDLVINATSAGHTGAVPAVPGRIVADGGDCYDLGYGASHGPFSEWAAAQGARRSEDGLGMLVEQAAGAFQIWRGVRPSTPPVLEALRREACEAAQGEGANRVRRSHVELPPQD